MICPPNTPLHGGDENELVFSNRPHHFPTSHGRHIKSVARPRHTCLKRHSSTIVSLVLWMATTTLAVLFYLYAIGLQDDQAVATEGIGGFTIVLENACGVNIAYQVDSLEQIHYLGTQQFSSISNVMDADVAHIILNKDVSWIQDCNPALSIYPSDAVGSPTSETTSLLYMIGIVTLTFLSAVVSIISHCPSDREGTGSSAENTNKSFESIETPHVGSTGDTEGSPFHGSPTRGSRTTTPDSGNNKLASTTSDVFSSCLLESPFEHEDLGQKKEDFLIDELGNWSMPTLYENSASSGVSLPDLEMSLVESDLVPSTVPQHLCSPSLQQTSIAVTSEETVSARFSRDDESDNNPFSHLYQNCTVMFADIANFTSWSSGREPTEVFTLLEIVFSAFDAIARRRGCFKVETSR
jgi:hypothetical protein